MAADAVAHGENGGQVVVVDGACNLAGPLLANLQVLLASCLRQEFTFFVNCSEMEVYVLPRGFKKFSNLEFGEPEGAIGEAAMDAGVAVFGLGKGAGATDDLLTARLKKLGGFFATGPEARFW